MKRILALLLAMTLALTIAGCLDYEETLELNADSSGSMTMRIVLYKHFFQEMMEMADSGMAGTAPDTLFRVFKREDVEKSIAEYKTNVQLLDFQEKMSDSTVAYDMKFGFKNLQDMIDASQKMGKNEMMGDEPKAPKVMFTKENAGGWKFTREFGAGFNELAGESGESDDPNTAEADTLSEPVDSFAQSLAEGVDTAMGQMGSMMEGMMKQMFGDHKIKMTVKFPGKVMETNATSSKDNTATWEYKFAEMSKAPKQLEAVVKP